MYPVISVIIPLYNAEKTILDTLESVKKQTYKGTFEILIINDGSTDNSQHLVEKYQTENPQLNIQVFHQENKGVSSARNKALKASTGDYIALLDADDIWLPKKTEVQMCLFEHYSNIDFLASCRKNHAPKFPYQIKNKITNISFRKLLFRNEAQPSTVLFKRKIMSKAGVFNQNQRYAEDVHYWLKISRHYNMSISNDQLIIADGGKKTFGASGLSANLKKMHQGFLSNLEFCLDKKWISPIEYAMYYAFYKIKYLVLLIRSI